MRGQDPRGMYTVGLHSYFCLEAMRIPLGRDVTIITSTCPLGNVKPAGTKVNFYMCIIDAIVPGRNQGMYYGRITNIRSAVAQN